MKRHELIEAVQEHFNIDTSQRSRRREVVDGRFAIMNALRPNYSMQEIANLFSYQKIIEDKKVYVPMSHCTVVHAVNQHKWKYHEDPFKRLVSYRFYGEVYDFCVSFLGSNYIKPITQIEMRKIIDHEKHLRMQAEHKAAVLQKKLNRYEKQNATKMVS